MQSLLHGAAQKEDEFINDIMTNHMFQDPNKGKTFIVTFHIICKRTVNSFII